MGDNEAGGTRHAEFGKYLVQKGHRFSVIGSTVSYLSGKPVKRSEDDCETGIDVHRAYTYHALHKNYFRRALSFITFMVSSFFIGLRIKDVDIIWGTSPPLFQGLTAWLLSKIKKAPFIFEVRDLWPAFAVDMGVLNNPLLIWVAETIERFLYRCADHLLINSPAYEDHLVQKGASRDQITLIPNGVDLSIFSGKENGQWFLEQYILEDKFVIIYAGAHGPANDLKVVMKAAELLKNHQDICFVLVGDGKEKSDLQHQAEAKNLQNVVFISPQPKSKMPEILGAADVGLAILKDIPMFLKTYPNKVFDYMAAGLPTLLVIDGVIREVIEKAEGGLFVPPGNPEALAHKVLYLSQNENKCREMGKSAAAFVQDHFDREEHAKVLEKVFLSLVDKS